MLKARSPFRRRESLRTLARLRLCALNRVAEEARHLPQSVSANMVGFDLTKPSRVEGSVVASMNWQRLSPVDHLLIKSGHRAEN
jgi:hypothetical protein